MEATKIFIIFADINKIIKIHSLISFFLELSASPVSNVESAVRSKLEEDEVIEASLPPMQKEKIRLAMKEKARARLKREEGSQT